MRIYVAGASKEVDMVYSYVQRLQLAGFTITHDWCAQVKANPADVNIDPETRAWHAERDLGGVGTAWRFWLITPEGQSVGAWVELGYALGLMRPLSRIVVSGPWRSIFTDIVKRYETHEEAFASLVADLKPQTP